MILDGLLGHIVAMQLCSQDGVAAHQCSKLPDSTVPFVPTPAALHQVMFPVCDLFFIKCGSLAVL